MSKGKFSQVGVTEMTPHRTAACTQCTWDYKPGWPGFVGARTSYEARQHVATTGHSVRADKVVIVEYYLPGTRA